MYPMPKAVQKGDISPMEYFHVNSQPHNTIAVVSQGMGVKKRGLIDFLV